MRFITLLALIFFAYCACHIYGYNTAGSDSSDRTNMLHLNLRFHIMKSAPWKHPSGERLNCWVTKRDVEKSILPQLNEIYKRANIIWKIESIIEEDIVKFDGYRHSIEYVLNTNRNSRGKSDPNRLAHLYNMMQERYRSPEEKLKGNLFHIYLFPFIGNTSQGNSMRRFGYHTVAGIWSNKYSQTNKPVKRKLTEDLNNFEIGSLTQTIAHELGHVLELEHEGQAGTNGNLMYSRGYQLEDWQIASMRKVALKRIGKSSMLGVEP